MISVTLDSGRGKRRLLRQWLTRVSSKGVFEEQEGEGVFEGLLQRTRMLGASTAVLAIVGCVRRFKRFSRERTLKSSTMTRRNPGRTE